MTGPFFRRLAGFLVVPTLAATYGVHRGLCYLEEKYPALPAKSTGSVALSTPRNPQTQRCAYTDVYAARIPLKALEARTITQALRIDRKAALEEAWARSLLNSKIIRTEGCLIGLLLYGRWTPGDTGITKHRFSPHKITKEPRRLLHGLLTVQRGVETEADSNGLLVSWESGGGSRGFFETAARWGYPWRMMSGGRHEMSVSEPFEVEGVGKMVEVRFATAHDYEVIASEGDKQKILPSWSLRLHRGFARLVLDRAVAEIEEKHRRFETR